MNLDVTFFAVIAGLLAGYSILAGLVCCEVKHAPLDPHDPPSPWCDEGDALTRCTKYLGSRDR